MLRLPLLIMITLGVYSRVLNVQEHCHFRAHQRQLGIQVVAMTEKSSQKFVSFSSESVLNMNIFLGRQSVAH